MHWAITCAVKSQKSGPRDHNGWTRSWNYRDGRISCLPSGPHMFVSSSSFLIWLWLQSSSSSYKLHWLSVQQRITYKLVVLTFKVHTPQHFNTSVDLSSNMIVHATHDRPPFHSCFCRSQRLGLTSSVAVIIILRRPSGAHYLRQSSKVTRYQLPVFKCRLKTFLLDGTFIRRLNCRQRLCSSDLMALYELDYWPAPIYGDAVTASVLQMVLFRIDSVDTSERIFAKLQHMTCIGRQ